MRHRQHACAMRLKDSSACVQRGSAVRRRIATARRATRDVLAIIRAMGVRCRPFAAGLPQPQPAQNTNDMTQTRHIANAKPSSQMRDAGLRAWFAHEGGNAIH